ncbi:MAG TPA: hypothetical protein VE860_21865, partial [Chthoniobacterales bacterium]|nr:hypothetical protein [Chthoniobacterales bacterium]
RVHALVLLRRRLVGLFGRSFQLEARSELGEGTTVTMRIPLRKGSGVDLESPRAITYDCPSGQELRQPGQENAPSTSSAVRSVRFSNPPPSDIAECIRRHDGEFGLKNT